jgi:hypothetical protein
VEPRLYVVQPFSRDHGGSLLRDAPSWSRDRSFAVALTQALAKRKAGVITVGVALAPSGELGAEAEIVGCYGSVPTEAVLPRDLMSEPRAQAPLGTRLRRRA